MSKEVVSEMAIEVADQAKTGAKVEDEEASPPPGQDTVKLTPAIYNMIISKVERALMRRLAQKEGENPFLVAADIRALIGGLKRPEEEVEPEEQESDEVQNTRIRMENELSNGKSLKITIGGESKNPKP